MGGAITVSLTPPTFLGVKSLVFLKCVNASKLTRETIGRDVVCCECSDLLLEHLEEIMTEIYMPLIATSANSVTGYVPATASNEEGKVINVIQGLVEAVQVRIYPAAIPLYICYKECFFWG